VGLNNPAAPLEALPWLESGSSKPVLGTRCFNISRKRAERTKVDSTLLKQRLMNTRLCFKVNKSNGQCGL